MDKFGIINGLKAAAQAKGWVSYFGVNDSYINAVTQGDDELAQLTLVYKFKATPKWSGAKVSQVDYTGRIMLGRKFDQDGQAADLDEDSQQKYDRRLDELTQILDNFLIGFKCDNELELVAHSGYEFIINAFDENIDFVQVQGLTLKHFPS